jgi:hypothetical protein
VRYEKAETILRIALDMQGTAEGLSLEDIQRKYSDKPLSRRTAERLRDAIERVFPQMRQVNPGELPKRWRLPTGTVSGFAAVSAEEFAIWPRGCRYRDARICWCRRRTPNGPFLSCAR